MPQYLYQVAYTSESLAAQIKNPQDRLDLVGKQITAAVGARILAGGYSYGEYDVSMIIDATDDVTMAARCACALASDWLLASAKRTTRSRSCDPSSVHQSFGGIVPSDTCCCVVSGTTPSTVAPELGCK